MLKALYTAATGMQSQQTQVDVIANNLANVNTAGFKRSDARFEDLLYVTRTAPGATNRDGSTVVGMQVGSGSRLVATARNFATGALIQTGNRLDLAISGEGFFELQAIDGSRVFTRDGSFSQDRDGNVVSQQGLKLVPSPGAIPAGAQITVNSDGSITATVGDSVQQLGQITLVMFTNPSGLANEGGNLYRETAASGPATSAAPGESGSGSILQGHQERSNVELATELINLILAQRAYEVNSKAISTADQMLSTTNQLAR